MASDPVQIKDLEFHRLQQIEVIENAGSINYPPRCDCLAVSSTFGLAFVCHLDKGFYIVQSSTVHQRTVQTKNDVMTICSDVPKKYQPLSGARSLFLNADQTKLSVVVERGENVFACLFELSRLFDAEPKPAVEIRLSNAGRVSVSDFSWNPVMSNLFAAVLSDGSIICIQLEASGGFTVNGRLESHANCLCWSPKGKQFITGNKDGSLSRYLPTIQLSKAFPAPTNFAVSGVSDIFWISTNQFAVVYCLPNDNFPLSLCLVTVSKAPPYRYDNFEDVCFGSDKRLPPRYFLNFISEWNILLCSSSMSSETGILGMTGQSFQLWNLESDAFRPELPFVTVNKSNVGSFPIGACMDYSNAVPVNIPFTETIVPPMPMLWLMSSAGTLVVYSCVEFDAGYQQKIAPVVLPSKSLPVSPGVTVSLGAAPATIQPHQHLQPTQERKPVPIETGTPAVAQQPPPQPAASVTSDDATQMLKLALEQKKRAEYVKFVNDETQLFEQELGRLSTDVATARYFIEGMDLSDKTAGRLRHDMVHKVTNLFEDVKKCEEIMHDMNEQISLTRRASFDLNYQIGQSKMREEQMNNDMAYRMLIRSWPLNPEQEQQMKQLRASIQHANEQFRQLRIEMQSCSNKSTLNHHKKGTVNVVYQSVSNMQDIIVEQTRRLNRLRLKSTQTNKFPSILLDQQQQQISRIKLGKTSESGSNESPYRAKEGFSKGRNWTSEQATNSKIAAPYPDASASQSRLLDSMEDMFDSNSKRLTNDQKFNLLDALASRTTPPRRKCVSKINAPAGQISIDNLQKRIGMLYQKQNDLARSMQPVKHDQQRLPLNQKPMPRVVSSISHVALQSATLTATSAFTPSTGSPATLPVQIGSTKPFFNNKSEPVNKPETSNNIALPVTSIKSSAQAIKPMVAAAISYPATQIGTVMKPPFSFATTATTSGVSEKTVPIVKPFSGQGFSLGGGTGLSTPFSGKSTSSVPKTTIIPVSTTTAVASGPPVVPSGIFSPVTAKPFATTTTTFGASLAIAKTGPVLAVAGTAPDSVVIIKTPVTTVTNISIPEPPSFLVTATTISATIATVSSTPTQAQASVTASSTVVTTSSSTVVRSESDGMEEELNNVPLQPPPAISGASPANFSFSVSPTTTQPKSAPFGGFGASSSPATSTQSSASSMGFGGFGGFGLGAKPDPATANKNAFGSFGAMNTSQTSAATNSLFGGQTAQSFGSFGGSPTRSAFGSPAGPQQQQPVGTTSVAKQGFGSFGVSPGSNTSTGFGSTASFGGSAVPTASGGQSGFGTGAIFGGSPSATTSSGFGSSSPLSGGSSFGGFGAGQSAPSFGGLAGGSSFGSFAAGPSQPVSGQQQQPNSFGGGTSFGASFSKFRG